MPDFDKLEQEAKQAADQHPGQVDDAISKGEQEVDQRLGGSHSSEVGKGGEELEKELGTYAAPQPPDQPQ